MAGTTAKGYPYPDPTDPIRDGADEIKALATAVDTRLGVMASGTVSLTTPASGAGTKDVVFPTGRFSAVPAVVVTLINTGSVISAGAPTATGVTATGFTMSYNRGSAATFTLAWVAVQS